MIGNDRKATLSNAIYVFIKSCGNAGCISDDILAEHDPRLYGSITPRYAELIKSGYIRPTGLTRNGRTGHPQRVLIATEYLPY